jgi:hypothetical protein
MGNLLQSSQNKATEAPKYYTSALCTLATKGKDEVNDAKFIGATDLQQQAFDNAAANAGAAKPTLCTSGTTLKNAAGVDISGAANPYLTEAFQGNVGKLAQCYMNPYIQNAVQGLSNIAMRNINQNLSPQATAASIGSGQFGSQRGAQVLGQIQANAMNDLNSQISGMQNKAYGEALQAATARQNLLNSLGSTAAQAATSCAAAKNTAGANLANLGKTISDVNIACTDLLAKMGAECQTIKQNEQCYGLAKLCKYATILGKNQVPTSVKTTLCMSPLSAVGAIGAGGLALLKCWDSVSGAFCKLKNIGKKLPTIPPVGGEGNDTLSGGTAPFDPNAGEYDEDINLDPNLLDPNSDSDVIGSFEGCCVFCVTCSAEGGLVTRKNVGGAVGCASLRNLGALPCRR